MSEEAELKKAAEDGIWMMGHCEVQQPWKCGFGEKMGNYGMIRCAKADGILQCRYQTKR